uniref:Conserved hypothetical phage tail region protein n=1 Tax=Candidatus Kentrum sp. SD TaxID=2126332 RepID=A0A450Y4Q3_9GAMM|nr:MAG: conserved hypothetical phage tail region protein [Candidatus Kentron sp. SD]VFK39159.1 MAG: conserved hypothetical phage tail region protein [Candidatus Kentron sp. SD]VFK77809.1 MAG: conserved hypothetical phage tail region protein [Candidatus Kentron sp. SD]
MATTKEEMKTAYPLPVYNYKVEIGGENVAFSEVSGLDITYETITHKESPGDDQTGLQVKHMPGQGTPANLTLKKGVVRGKSVSTLYKWISSIRLNQIDKKDVVIRLCDEEGKAVISWKVINAFPTVLEAPTFDASENEVAVESMELMADDVKIEES